jgi:hypothetical protein
MEQADSGDSSSGFSGSDDGDGDSDSSLSGTPPEQYHLGWPASSMRAVRNVLGGLTAQSLPLMPGLTRIGDADTARLLSLLLGTHGPAAALNARDAHVAHLDAKAASFQQLLVAAAPCESCGAAGTFRGERCVAARSVYDFYNAVPGCRASRAATLAWPEHGLQLTFPHLPGKEARGHDGYIYVRSCGWQGGAGGVAARRAALAQLQAELRRATACF